MLIAFFTAAVVIAEREQAWVLLSNLFAWFRAGVGGRSVCVYKVFVSQSRRLTEFEGRMKLLS
jgi:hypothetical protein